MIRWPVVWFTLLATIATTPGLSFAAVIPPSTPPGPNPDGRRYEMVTPPDKNNRRAGDDSHQVADGPKVGIASPDGNNLLFSLSLGILYPDAGTAFSHLSDVVAIRRDEQGAQWVGEAVNTLPLTVPGTLPQDGTQAVAADFTTVARYFDVDVFAPSRSKFGIYVSGGSDGHLGTQWYDWFAGNETLAGSVPVAINRYAALIDDDGSRLIAWGPYPGLLDRGTPGDEDPSSTQISGDSIYLQTSPGLRDLVHECTGGAASDDATELPARVGDGSPDDVLGIRSCESGSVTSSYGAVAGTRSRITSGDAALVGPATTALSSDGRRVFFTSPDPAETLGLPPNNGALVAGCTTATGNASNCQPQVFVRQYDSHGEPTVRWISRPAEDMPDQEVGLLGRGAAFEGASDDGSVVYFRSNAPLTTDDPNGTGGPGPVTTGVASPESWDLYRYELSDVDSDPGDGTLRRISGGPQHDGDPNTGSQGTSARYISADGHRAYFVTASPLDGADQAAPIGSHPGNQPAGAPTNVSTRNLYMYENSSGVESWKFVAQLPYATSGIDACATFGQTSSPPLNFSNGVRRATVNCVRGTPTGDAIVFETTAQLTEDDTDGAGDVYLYDAGEDKLVRLSAPTDGGAPYACGGGATCNGDLGFDAVLSSGGTGHFGRGGFRSYNIASDAAGNLDAVYFETRHELVEDDTNGTRYDVYQWKGGNVTLISPGDSDDDSWFSGNGSDGKSVFFTTAKRIDPREIEDGDFDVYVARVGGGFPYELPPAPCGVLIGACDNGASGTPAFAGPGSGVFVARDDTVPARTRRLTVSKLGPKQRRALARRGRSVLKVKVPNAGRISVRSRHLRRVERRVARATKIRIPLRLTASARRVLARRGRLVVRVVVRFGDVLRTATVTLRRPR